MGDQIYKNDQLVIICCSLSMLGSLFILLSFVILQHHLKGLFARMIIYLTLSDIMQTYGILMSGPLSKQNQCQYFAALRVFGSLSLIFWSVAILWSIKQIFQVYMNGGLIDKIEQENQRLQGFEIYFLFICYGIPFILVQWPLWTRNLNNIITAKNYTFCYIYATQSSKVGLIDTDKVIIWEIPFFLYFLYAGFFIKQILRTHLYQEELYNEIKIIIIKQMIIPCITFFCTIWFTIDDIMKMANKNDSSQYTIFAISMLAIWGFFNAIAYFIIEEIHKLFYYKIRQICQKQKNTNEQDVLGSIQQEIGSGDSNENSDLEINLYRSTSTDIANFKFHDLYVARLNQKKIEINIL